jgi:hypothetical protein
MSGPDWLALKRFSGRIANSADVLARLAKLLRHSTSEDQAPSLRLLKVLDVYLGDAGSYWCHSLLGSCQICVSFDNN